MVAPRVYNAAEEPRVSDLERFWEPLDRYDLLSHNRLREFKESYKKLAPISPYLARKLFHYVPSEGAILLSPLTEDDKHIFVQEQYFHKWQERAGSQVCKGPGYTRFELWRSNRLRTRIRGHQLAGVLYHGWWPHSARFKNNDPSDLSAENLVFDTFIDWPIERNT